MPPKAQPPSSLSNRLSKQTIVTTEFSAALTPLEFIGLLTHGLPLDTRESIISKFSSEDVQSQTDNVNPSFPVETSSLGDLFRNSDTSPCLDLEVIPSSDLDMKDNIPDAFLIYGTLRRTHKKVRIKNDTKFSETVMLTKASRTSCHPDHNHRFKTHFLVLPYAAVFYSPMRLLGKKNNLPVPEYAPLPISWLRIRLSDHKFAKGSYLESADNIWRINWTNVPRRVVHGVQFPDESFFSPLLPPDIMDDVQYKNTNEARIVYQRKLRESDSNKYGCRKYVKNAFHQKIDSDTTLVYDPKEKGDVVFHITIQDEHERPHSHTLIQTFTVPYDFYHHSDICKHLLLRTPSLLGSTRSNCGDRGSMNAIGLVVDRNKGVIVESKIVEKNPSFVREIPHLCLSAAKIADRHIPGMRSSIQRFEAQTELEIPCYLAGRQGFACHMVASVDLGNATHYDVNDVSPALLIYDEIVPGCATNWYFVFPNILIKYADKTYNGLAIRCGRGVAINWDGRLQRHGTAITNLGHESNHTIGWFWCGSTRTILRSINNSNDTTKELLI